MNAFATSGKAECETVPTIDCLRPPPCPDKTYLGDRPNASPGIVRTATGEAIATMDEQTERYHVLINRLEERLNGYLTPDFPRPPLEKPKMPTEASPMLLWVNEKIRALDGANQRLEHLMGRIQT